MIYKPQRDVLGFSKGPIIIFRESFDETKEKWFIANHARYTRFWGWYFRSEDTSPDFSSADLIPYELPWANVGNSKGDLFAEDEVIAAVDKILYPEKAVSNWVGSIGERLDLVLTVVKTEEIPSKYGRGETIHTMVDKDNNYYRWITTAQHWGIGSVKPLRGTIKEQIIEKGIKYTILTRCREIF